MLSEMDEETNYLENKRNFEETLKSMETHDIYWNYLKDFFDALKAKVDDCNARFNLGWKVYVPGGNGYRDLVERRVDTPLSGEYSVDFRLSEDRTKLFEVVYQKGVYDNGIFKPSKDLEANSYTVTINESNEICFEDSIRSYSKEEVIDYWLKKLKG